MILYKYLSKEAGLKMLQSSTLGFSQIRTFNDPTEATAAEYKGEDTSILAGFPRGFFMNSQYAICCLTRTALNPVMWAHYADKHRGLVIGIDSVEANLESTKSSVLPAKYGSVIYTASKPTHGYGMSDDPLIRDGAIEQFNPDALEALQRMFLQKSAEWAYEEEVRTIRTTESLKEVKTINQHELLPGYLTYLLPIPPTAIRSVHIGWHATIDGYDDAAVLYRTIKRHAPPC